jgi:carboxymethylenebutenolidase
MPAFRARRAALDVAALAALLSLAAACAHRQPAPAEHAEHTAAAAPASATIAAGATTAAAASASAAGQDPALPASAATAEARLASSTRHGEYAMIFTGPNPTDSVRAWVVYPERKTKAPVVIVIHEIFGLSSWVRSVADQLAADGFIAIAPDFLTRVRGGPTSVELPGDSARRLIGQVNSAERNRIITAAANWAMTQPAATQKYAVIGYCWGGSTTFMHSVHGGVKGFSGGVAFYGMPYTTGGRPATATEPAVPGSVSADSLARIKEPVMLLNGSRDTRIAAAMPAIDSIMKALDKKYTGVNYEGAIHGFLRVQDDPKAERNEAEEQANLAAAKDAWPRTIAFLREHLK